MAFKVEVPLSVVLVYCIGYQLDITAHCMHILAYPGVVHTLLLACLLLLLLALLCLLLQEHTLRTC